MNKSCFIKLVSAVFIAAGVFSSAFAQPASATVLIKIFNTANNKPVVLMDSAYTNSFGESYQLSKLKYYISNIHLSGKPHSYKSKNVFLIDAAATDSIVLKLQPGIYTKLIFVLGVDSMLNCSGAQAGALDPLNGMFWTWNSGYVFFKLEGYSTSSTADLQRIEHHIGGYQGINKAARIIALDLKEPLVINENNQKEIIIQVNLDKYWQEKNDIKIATNALIMVPGEWAKKSADNFAGMFSILSIK